MKAKKEDRRIRKTKKALRKGFAELIMKKEIEHIFFKAFDGQGPQNPIPALIKFNAYLAENSEACQLFLTKNGNVSFADKLTGILQNGYLYEWLKYTTQLKDPSELGYLCDFLMSGYIAIIKRWITSGMPDSPEKLAEKMLTLALHGISTYS